MNFFKKIQRHSITKNAIALTSIQIANYAVPLLLLPFLTRVLGIESFGIVAVTLALNQFALVLTTFGFELSATYAITQHHDDHSFINKKLNAVIQAQLILYLVACIIIISISTFIPSYELYQPFFLTMLIATFFQTFQPIWFFLGLEKMKYISIYSVSTKIFYAALVLVFIRQPSDAICVILFWGLAQAIGSACSIYFIYKEGFTLTKINLAHAIYELKKGMEFFWARLAVSVYTSLSIVLVGIAGPIQASFYSVPEQIYKAGQNLTSPLSTAMFPYMAKNKDWNVFFKVFFSSLFILVVGSLIFFLLAEDILVFVFGEEYRDAVNILYIFILAVNIQYVAVTFGYSAFSALNRIDIANKTVIIGGVLHLLVLSVIFFNNISAFQVALAVLLTETSVSLMRIILFIKIKNKTNDISL